MQVTARAVLGVSKHVRLHPDWPTPCTEAFLAELTVRPGNCDTLVFMEPKDSLPWLMTDAATHKTAVSTTVCPPVPILRRINPIHTLPLYFSKIHLNIIIPCKSRSRSFERSLPFRLIKQNFEWIFCLPVACYKLRPPTSSLIHVYIIPHNFYAFNIRNVSQQTLKIKTIQLPLLFYLLAPSPQQNTTTMVQCCPHPQTKGT
jgi:hypothetical protein